MALYARYLPRDEKKNGGNMNVVLQKDTENPLKEPSKQRECLKENDNKRTLRYRKRQLEILVHIMREVGLANLLLKEHIEVKRDRERQCATYLAGFSE